MFATVDTSPFTADPAPPPAPPSRLGHDVSHQPPGPMLALMLDSIDVCKLTAHDQVVVLRHHQRMASY